MLEIKMQIIVTIATSSSVTQITHNFTSTVAKNAAIAHFTSNSFYEKLQRVGVRVIVDVLEVS
jgi:hypothetical protein